MSENGAENGKRHPVLKTPNNEDGKPRPYRATFWVEADQDGGNYLSGTIRVPVKDSETGDFRGEEASVWLYKSSEDYLAGGENRPPLSFYESKPDEKTEKGSDKLILRAAAWPRKDGSLYVEVTFTEAGKSKFGDKEKVNFNVSPVLERGQDPALDEIMDHVFKERAPAAEAPAP